MVYKLFNEDGDYVDKVSGESRNLLEANWADTPEGLNVGWTEFDSLEDAEEHFNLKKKETSIQNL